jgi:hypothetical protein
MPGFEPIMLLLVVVGTRRPEFTVVVGDRLMVIGARLLKRLLLLLGGLGTAPDRAKRLPLRSLDLGGVATAPALEV